MPSPTAPLLFPDILDSPGVHAKLGKTHGLNSKDFSWLAHVQLATHALRQQQTPPMHAERILLNADKQQPVPLTGSFILGAGRMTAACSSIPLMTA